MVPRDLPVVFHGLRKHSNSLDHPVWLHPYFSLKSLGVIILKECNSLPENGSANPSHITSQSFKAWGYTLHLFQHLCASCKKMVFFFFFFTVKKKITLEFSLFIQRTNLLTTEPIHFTLASHLLTQLGRWRKHFCSCIQFCHDPLSSTSHQVHGLMWTLIWVLS